MFAAGMDGGGTRTRALLLDGLGSVAGYCTGGCGNFQMIGAGGLEQVVGELLGRLWAGAERRPLSLCLGLAGVGRPDDRAEVAALARRCGWAERVQVVSDARAALEGAHGGAAGLIVIAGTGSIVLGKGHDGQETRAGGWGPLLGDQGSGYLLALSALRAALRAHDGWGPATVLDADLRRTLRLSAWEPLVRRVYGGDLGREHIAALAPVVLAAARAGDAVAAELVAEAGRALGGQVAAVARRLGLADGAAVAGAGGLLAAEDLWPWLEQGARECGIPLHRRTAMLPPVAGAALLAWQDAGGDVAALASGLARVLPAEV